MIIVQELPSHLDRVPGPGFWRMPAAKYHADCAPEPSLSSSIAKKLLDESPLHCWTDHPRLNPDFEAADEKKFDFGSVAHELMLGHGAGIVEVFADDWRKKDTQAERDRIIATGGQPILSKDLRRAELMIASGRGQLAGCDLGHVFGDPSVSEVVMVWQDDGGVWCRAMLDWHAFEGIGLTVYDLKTSGTTTHPNKLDWKIVDLAYEVSAGFYERGLAVLLPEMLGRLTWRWVFQEIEAPFAMTVCELDGAGKTIGAKKAAAAVAIWRECVETGKWPRWPTGVHRIAYPIKAEQNWTEREMSDPQLQALAINTLAPVHPAGSGLDMLKEIA